LVSQKAGGSYFDSGMLVVGTVSLGGVENFVDAVSDLENADLDSGEFDLDHNLELVELEVSSIGQDDSSKDNLDLAVDNLISDLDFGPVVSVSGLWSAPVLYQVEESQDKVHSVAGTACPAALVHYLQHQEQFADLD
jgi:hypothetical protein